MNKYRFILSMYEMNQSHMISAFCNDKEPKYMAEDVIVFEMKNK